jgi:hypothetical protein
MPKHVLVSYPAKGGLKPGLDGYIFIADTNYRFSFRETQPGSAVVYILNFQYIYSTTVVGGNGSDSPTD